MLGWVLRRGLENAAGVKPATGDDTSQFEQPDTPAPVFAARALKRTIWGTPAPEHDDTMTTNLEKTAPELARNGSSADVQTPSKIPGILLTPGTGTTRRKRVSFGHDVLGRGSRRGGRNVFAARDVDPIRKRAASSSTTLGKSKAGNETTANGAPTNQKHTEKELSESDWEEDEEDEDDNNTYSHDMTTDLNEPHSHSGKYWKSNFEKYHKDAKAEMEKLLKYKQLAKSYAKMKDAEALDLNGKLREEQEKVADMEKRLSQMASQMASRRRLEGSDGESPDAMRNLARQTALAVQYCNQVKELETLLREARYESDTKARRTRASGGASPRTQKTLLETQRELRRAKSQLRDLDNMREEARRLRSELAASEQRAARLAEENRKSARVSSVEDGDVARLKRQLQRAREENQMKEDEVQQLQREFDEYRTEATAREDDAKQVLEKAMDKISELKREVKQLKANRPEGNSRPTSRYAAASTTEGARVSSDGHGKSADDARGNLHDLARLTNSTSRGNIRTGSPERRRRVRASDSDTDIPKDGQESVSLRERFENLRTPKTAEPALVVPASTIFEKKADLERPKWQPYIPRSPRRRERHVEDASKRSARKVLPLFPPGDTAELDFDHEAPAGQPHDEESIFDVPQRHRGGLSPSHRRRRPMSTIDTNEPEIDLAQRHFPRLDADTNTSALLPANTSRSALPPDRRAAALARLEMRKAEKSRTARKGSDKENERPRPVSSLGR